MAGCRLSGCPLVAWRDFLAPQLRLGQLRQDGRSISQLARVYLLQSTHALLGSQERMQSEIFVHLPLEQVQGYR